MNTRKLSAFAGKYKYVLIILLAGLILLLLPGGSRTKAEPAAAQPIDTQTQTIQTEPAFSRERLAGELDNDPLVLCFRHKFSV